MGYATRYATRTIDGGHEPGASDLAIFERADCPLRCTALFAFFLVLTESRRGNLAADDARDAVLHQGFAEVQPVPPYDSA